jgi:hypothetical protein
MWGRDEGDMGRYGGDTGRYGEISPAEGLTLAVRLHGALRVVEPLEELARALVPRGDVGEMQGRCRGDVGEM